ncbi:hypothetical protein G7046_g6607 [Stylonectria norvegica]|nr:hypothetical protein G7046_g6607 [Stylonectria norvegica]
MEINAPMMPNILQTCKGVYYEANPILYNRNIFSITEPDNAFRFFEIIGPENVKLVRSLDIWVSSHHTTQAYVKLFEFLATHATGLQVIKIVMDATVRARYNQSVGGRSMAGRGRSTPLVHALGQIRGLSRLYISGFYMSSWLPYLRERMGEGVVQAESGYPLELGESEDDRSRELRVQQFKEFQLGGEEKVY